MNSEGKVVGRVVRELEAPSESADSSLGLPPRTRGFLILLENGTRFEFDLTAPNQSRLTALWYFSPLGALGVLAVMALAVVLCVYPVVRRLTKNIEALQQGVEAWGEGNLSKRISVEGADEVGFLAQKFNYAAGQIESLMTAHRVLLANASHELRSPLARIRMGLELWQGMPDRSSANVVEQEIKRNISELDSLIEEILLASRLNDPNANIGSIESFDLMGLAAEECARVNAELVVADNTPTTFELLGYPKLMRRLLRNLLENAARHHKADKGSVTLELTRSDKHLHVTVLDQGDGVPSDEVLRIFEPFYRAQNTSERDGGVGLGLALVKSITNVHHGEVFCLSKGERAPNGSVVLGGCFVAKFPFSEHPSAEPQAA